MLIFDYDGVIVDSLDYNLAITNQACRSVIPDAPSATRHDLYQLDSMTFDELAAAIGIAEKYVPACLKEINRLLAVPNLESELFAGMEEFIADAADKYRLAIVSHNTEHAINQVLADRELDGFFSAVMGVESPGNKAEKIGQLLRQYHEPPQACCMIGDAVSDITAAQDAGICSIAVSWGFQPAAVLQAAQPDFMAWNINDLRQILLN